MTPGPQASQHRHAAQRRTLHRANWAVILFLFGTLCLYFHLPGFGQLPDLAKLGIIVGLLVSNVIRLGYEAMLKRRG